MKGSFSEANLPTLPGIRKYTPKRTTWGRMKYFDISADGVMLEARPASSPSRDQASLEASRLRRSQSMSRSMLRPLSATEVRMSDSVQSLQDAMQDTDIPARLSRTIRKKEEVVANIRQLDPLTINQRRVALQKELKDLETAEKSILKENLAPQAAGIKPSRSQLALTNPPDWVKYDRQVLRYYVYFKEAVPESAQETYRIRKGILLYFLADKTMSLTEPRIVNSGLAQGEFYKRGPMVDPRTGQAYQPSDFKIGGEIKVLSTVYRIVDMDVQTRKYHQGVLGQRVPEAEAYPENPIDARMKFSDLNRMKNPKLSRRITNEALLGGRPGLFGYPIIKSVEGKDDIQGKILRFRGIWDDSEVLYGARNEYNIQYFLEDDEVEIRKRRGGKKAGSSAKEPTLVLKKSRLPRDFTVKDNDMPDKPLGRNEEKYYTDKDFILGNYINFYGRDVLLTWCDKETERYFKEKHGFQQVPVYVKPEDPPVVKHEIPPYNGWGSERDTLASCMSLNPVPVRRDLLKFMENQGKTLRYTAKFSNPKTTADSERRFVFTYYLEDSTLSIFEPPQRNSGVVGGKFLARGAYKRTVREKDSDELNPHVKRDKDPLVKLLKEKLQQYMSGSKYMLLNAFKHFGGIGGGDAITLTEFKHGCMMCGMPMKKAEARHLFNLYDVDNSGSISFKEFVEGVMENTYGKFGSAAGRSTARWIRPSDFFVGAKIKIQFPRNGAETAEYTILGADAYTLTLMEMRPQDFPKSNVEHIIRELATRLQQYNVNVRQVFKSYDTRGEGHISHEQFKALLGKWAKDFGFVDEELSQQDLITLTRHYDEDDDGYISIKEFCDALTSTPIILLNEIDEEHIEAAERKLYDELHPLPPGKLRETFNSMDKLGNGMITIGEFHEFLEAHEIKLNDIETAALFQHYDVRNEGVFDYNEFAALMEAEHYISTKKKKKKREKKKEIVRSSYVDILKRREHELSDDAKFNSMIKTFCRFFFPRRITLRKAFLSHDHKGTGVVNKVDFISSVRKTNADFPKASLDAMVSALFTDEAMSAVNFQDFMDIVWRQDVKTFKNLIARGTRLDKRETWGNVHSELQADE